MLNKKSLEFHFMANNVFRKNNGVLPVFPWIKAKNDNKYSSFRPFLANQILFS